MNADIIDSYDRLPLGKYLYILALPAPDGDGSDYQVAVIAILTGMTPDGVLDLPLGDYKRAAEASHFLTQPVKTTPGKRMADTYRLGDLTLVPVRDARKMTAAQYIDFQSLLKGGEQQLPAMLAAVMVPEGHRYGDGYDFDEVRRAIRDHLTVTQAEQISAFFLKKFTDLTRTTLTSFRLALRLMPRKARRTPEGRKLMEMTEAAIASLTDGGGLRALMK